MKITVANPCGESSVWSYFTIDPIGNYRLANTDASPDLAFHATLSPNPTTGKVQLSYELPTTGTLNLRLYSQDGRLVQQPLSQQQAEAGTHEHKFSLAGLPAGMYLWQLQSEHGVKTGRLIRR